MSGFATPSEAPASGGDFKINDEENIGSLFVIEPIGPEQEHVGSYGPSKYIPCNITEIDYENPAESVTHENSWVFPAWIRGAIRHLITEGGMTLGTLRQDAEKGQGKNAAWVLDDPDEEDITAATAWLNSRSRGKLGVSDEPKKKKGKK